MALRGLPASKKLNVALGAALAVAGALVVLASFSGGQAYNIAFFYVAVGGALLALFGIVLLANSRVVHEGGARPRPRATVVRAPAQPAARLPRLGRARGAEWVRLQCPECRKVFEAQGVRPFQAECPRCHAAGTIA